MGTFYAVMAGSAVADGPHDIPWQTGMYLESADPTVFNAYASWKAACEALWSGTGDPDDGLIHMYSNLVKLQRVQVYDFSPALGTKGLTLKVVEDIPGTGLTGRLPAGLACMVRLYGAAGVRSVGKMMLPAPDLGHCGPFGELNFHAVIVLPASLALFFGSLATNGYAPSLYRRPTHDFVPAAEYSWSARFWYLRSREDQAAETVTRTSL